VRHLRRALLFSIPVSLFTAILFAPRPASAQVHWDIGADVGAMKRFFTSGPDGGSSPGFGPTMELHAHFALIPLVRVGAYVSHDISPLSSIPARQITSGGLHLRINSPWPSGKWHGWLFAGFGYAGVYAPSYHGSFSNPGDPNAPPAADVFVEGSNGNFFEVPLGVGVAYKLARPFELTASLGTRLGFGFTGDVYNARAGHTLNQPPLDVEAAGNDALALFATLGVSFEL
jgi:hypothetical protein